MLSDVEYWKIRDTDSNFDTVWWGYPHNGDGLLGSWFFTNSENMNKFSRLYDNLNEYTKVDNCPNDRSDRISNHRLSLYHLEQINLIDNLKFCEKNWHDDFGTVRRRYYKTK
jgi:hypothetical protein